MSIHDDLMHKEYLAQHDRIASEHAEMLELLDDVVDELDMFWSGNPLILRVRELQKKVRRP